MKPTRKKRGQFIIIAVLLTAIMIISIGALMHSAVTYYKYEPWEEYSTLIGDIEINSAKLVELSLVNYTNTAANSTILDYNLERWQNDLKKIYPSRGIVLKYTSSSLSRGSSPTGKADFTLDIKTIGLTGYKFSTTTTLSVAIVRVYSLNSTSHEITAVVTSESGQPIPNLKKNNFRINNTTPTAVRPAFHSVYVLVYEIEYKGTLPATMEVWDHRGIRAVRSIS